MSSNSSRTLSAILLLLLFPTLSTCGKDSPTKPTVSVPSSITITPASASLTRTGETVQLTAIVRDNNANTITGASITWSSSNANVAKVSPTGSVTAGQNGMAIITAVTGGVSAQAAITVDISVAATVTITPSTANLTAVGQTVQLAAVVRDQRGRQLPSATVTWSSSDERVATVDSRGLVTAEGQGSAEITARSGDAAGTMTVSVMQQVHSITLTPASASMVIGDTLRVIAEATDANGNLVSGVPFTWTSSDDAVANVDETGLVTALQSGTVTITAVSGEVRGMAGLTIGNAEPNSVTVTPTRANLTAIGQTVQLAAVVRDQRGRQLPSATVTWSSSDERVATVDSRGLVTAEGQGSAEITARSGDAAGTMTVSVMQQVHSITLTPASASMVIGDTLRVIAEATDANGNLVSGVPFTWTSSDDAVANVDETGLVTALQSGTATVNAHYESLTGEVSLIVRAAQTNLDRIVLESFYYATNGENWNDNSGWLSDEPLYNWFGVSADSSDRVTGLDLDANNVSGPLIPELGKLSALRHLRLIANPLTGPIPTELGNLTELRVLWLWQGGLTGPIPFELGNLTNLQQLFLTGNSLSGSIPSELGHMHNLQVLRLDSNNLGGSIPPELGDLRNLKELVLSNNQLTGSVPEEIGKLTSLEYMHLSRNELAGPLPLELSRLQRLGSSFGYINLEDTKICAPLVPEFQEWLKGVGNKVGVVNCEDSEREILYAFYLTTGGENWTHSNNWLTNEPFSEWYGVTAGDDGRILRLNLEDNNLRGTLLPEIGNLTELVELNLGFNDLRGKIPSTIGDLVGLESLDLGSNAVVGQVPPEIGKLERLVHLDLSHNDLNGILPSTFENLGQIRSLRLEGTRLCASLESGFQAWLQVIPDRSVVNCVNVDREALVALYHATDGPNWTDSAGWLTDRLLTDWFGVTADSNGIVSEIDLPSNNLSGRLPDEIGDLVNPKRMDFSSNILSGPLPITLTHLTELETLSLADTQLCAPLDVEFQLWLDGINDIDVSNCPNRDRDALVALYHATNGSMWTNSTGWLTEQQLASWHGVTIDLDGRVIKLSLFRNNLTGRIPPEIEEFGRLQELDLRQNMLSGAIPREVGELSKLKKLELTGNQLSGEIPGKLGDLGELLTLNLGGNDLGGSIPTELGSLNFLNELWLFDNRLQGEIPISLSKLDHLTVLDIGNNRLDGEIPYELGRLNSLKELTLSDNELSGDIPVALGDLKNLESLSLAGNRLGGEIPLSLGKLTSLKSLRLPGNEFTGEIPKFLTNLDNLLVLNLNSNELHGPIPVELSQLVSLRAMYLANNNLNGEIPASLGNLSSLEDLNLESNKLTGSVPPELGNLRNLRRLWLSDNDLAGPLPYALTRLKNLNSLWLAGTRLCILSDAATDAWLAGIEDKRLPPDCIDPDRNALIALYNATGGPRWLHRSNWLTEENLADWHGVTTNAEGRVVKSDLAGNGLNGEIPPEVGILNELESLDLSGNALTGQIPAELGNLDRLRNLDLSQNELGGSIPAELGDLSELESLILNQNFLAGPVPPEFARLTNIEVLWLQDTELCIPTFGNLQTWLRGIPDHRVSVCGTTDRDALAAFYHATDGPNWLNNTGWLSDAPLDEWYGVDTDGSGRVIDMHFDYNRITGRLPQELGHLTELRRFLIEFNGPDGLTGTIPAELSNLKKLEQLHLRGNGFTGPIPSDLGDLPNLKHLDLSGNELSGSVPRELGSLASLRSLNLSANDLNGEIPSTLGSLSNLEALILSLNYLTGRIPSELGNLSRLRSLWLSELELSGEVPSALSNLSLLEELILHDNSLQGEIPPALGRLANLEKLYLNQNPDLSGPIPEELGNLAELEILYLGENSLSGPVPEALGNLGNLRELTLFDNPGLSGPLPVALTKLELSLFQAYGTKLCAPSGAVFGTWLQGITRQRIVRCDPKMEIRAYLTQATQSLNHTVPLVAGESAFLRVFVAAEEQYESSVPAIRATFYQNDMIVHSVDVSAPRSSISTKTNEGELSSSANVEIPAEVIQPGLEMKIDVYPEGTEEEFFDIGHRIDGLDRSVVEVMDVPALDLTIVPLLWLENPDRSVLYEAEGLTADDELFRFAHEILPVREFNLEIRDFVWTGLEPIAENSYEILLEIKALQAADGIGGYYMGILTRGGGIAFLDGTVSAAVLNEYVIAHELGHNFSLLHAPCGDPQQVDFFYPYKDGNSGSWGYDVRTGSLVAPDTPELMSYCGPPNWISDYHFGQAIRFRQSEFTRTAARTAATRSLLVWGGVDGHGELILNPSFIMDGANSHPFESGQYRIIGRNNRDQLLFSVDFAMEKIADAEGSGFVIVLPVQPTWQNQLSQISLSGPEGLVTIDESSDVAMGMLKDSVSGKLRGFLRNVSSTTSDTISARRNLPETGLDVVISEGVPRPQDW